MADFTTAATAWPRLAAPGTTRLRGPCLSALSRLAVRLPASASHDHSATPAAKPTI